MVSERESAPLADRDPWQGLQTDVIQRFLDVSCAQGVLTRAARRGHLEDLMALDQWLLQMKGHTLVTARADELSAYFGWRVTERRRLRLAERLLTSLHLFYAYLKASGGRADNPVDELPECYALTTRAKLRRMFAMLTKPRAIGMRC